MGWVPDTEELNQVVSDNDLAPAVSSPLSSKQRDDAAAAKPAAAGDGSTASNLKGSSAKKNVARSSTARVPFGGSAFDAMDLDHDGVLNKTEFFGAPGAAAGP